MISVAVATEFASSQNTRNCSGHAIDLMKYVLLCELQYKTTIKHIKQPYNTYTNLYETYKSPI